MIDPQIDDVLEAVKWSAIRNGLVLFLGAGVNGGQYPLWDGL
jgi:hypothetical protein